VARGARIDIDWKPGQLSGLPVGANVTLSKFVDSHTAGNVQGNGRNLFGAAVKGVDAEKNTITVADRDGEKTFAVAQDTCITVDRKPNRLTAVPKGAFVNMALKVDQATVCTLGADGPHLGGCGGSMVKAVDPEKSTITFDDKAAPDVAGKTFTITRDAGVTIEGKPGKLADVPAGAYVNVTLTVDQQTAHQVHAQGPPVQCDCGGSMVKAVDVEKNTITFDDRARAEVAGKTFAVAKDAYILVDNKVGTLAGIPVGALVDLRLSLDQKTARQVRANGGTVTGVVKALDAEKSTVTVEDTTYPVARDALIVIDGKEATMAGLATGASVHLNLRVDQKTVGMIQTKAP
jgi:hypothetical protein